MQVGSIDLTTVNETKSYKKANNGRSYLNFAIVELKEPDKIGNTHTIYVQQSKEEREVKADKVYIGKCKILSFDQKQTQQTDDYFPF